MLFDPGLGYIGEGWHSVLVKAGAVGVHVSAVASVLSWCFLLMALSLLTRRQAAKSVSFSFSTAAR